MNNSSLGDSIDPGEGTSGTTPLLDQNQPGPSLLYQDQPGASFQNVRDEFLVESDSDEDDVFNNQNGNDSSDGDEEDNDDNAYQSVRPRKDRLVHDIESCQDASNYNRYL